MTMHGYKKVIVFLIKFFYSKRVFILGPSHHVYLPGCALSSTSHYETPLYNLEIDKTSKLTLNMYATFCLRSENLLYIIYSCS